MFPTSSTQTQDLHLNSAFHPTFLHNWTFEMTDLILSSSTNLWEWRTVQWLFEKYLASIVYRYFWWSLVERTLKPWSSPMIGKRVEIHIVLFRNDKTSRMMHCCDPIVWIDSQTKGQNRVQDLSKINIQGSTALIKANWSRIIKLFLVTICSWSRCESGLLMGWYVTDF